MSYKTILTVLTDPALIPATLDQAEILARTHDAHLDVLCLGVDRTQTGYYYAGANALILQETIARAETEANEIEAQVKARLERSGVRWSTDAGVSQMADIARHVAARARFADLAVLPKPYGATRGAELEPVIESAMFEGLCPILVVPGPGHAMTAPKRIVIGWNESREALVAVKAALPLLAQADLVHVVVVDPPSHGPSRSDPGGPLSQYLARHGVRAEIDVLSKTLPRISDVLIRHANDVNADLLVMGAYGHSRFREAILGGATRNMLEQSEQTVFMAH
jgi:nucleotide-binding universal stress UspA family protein